MLGDIRGLVLLGVLLVHGLEDVGLPLTNRNTLSEEARNLSGGASGSLTDAEPGVEKGQAGGASVDEANHGAKTAIVVHVRGGEGEGPGDEVEDDNGGGHDLVLVGADCHLTGNGVGQGTDTVVVSWTLLVLIVSQRSVMETYR